MSELPMLKERLVKASKILYKQKLVRWNEGNISARVSKKNQFLIKARGISMREVKPEDFISVTLDVNIPGEREPSLETPMHGEIYRVRSDVMSIVHTHSMIATAFGISGKKISPIWLRGADFLRDVPIVEYRLPGSQELATVVKEKIVNRDAILLQNHGIITVGRDIEEACRRAIILEDAAKIQLISLFIGKPRKLTGEEIEKFMLMELNE
jgi:L-ribulose-5-phosphate 4-epimerase